jgi:1,4-dihydroxy-2-naphthoate octaprenyltransferase
MRPMLSFSGVFWLPLFLAMLFSCLWIQIATNLFNEYYDFKRGLDTEDSVGMAKNSRKSTFT